MADQGRWFKLWCCANTDQALSNLDIADFGRWAKLGAYIKEQGTDGVLKMPMPARYLVHLMQVKDVTELVTVLNCLPNISAELISEKPLQQGNENVTFVCVTYRNWRRWQGDWSRDRVAEFRKRKRNEIASLSSSPSPSNKGIKEKSEKPSKGKASRIPDDFDLTEARIQIANNCGILQNPAAIFEDFKLYWQNIPGQKGMKINWDQTWQRWCLNEVHKYGKAQTKEHIGVATVSNFDDGF